MAETNQLVVMITSGLDDERSSVAWSVANGGIAGGLKLTVFLAGSGVEWARKRVGIGPHLNPLDPPVYDMVEKLMSAGGKVFACPPCSGVRGLTPETMIEGVVISGSGAMHERIKEGAATLCF